MAIRAGYTFYQSDRTNEGEYLLDGDPRTSNYITIKRWSADGTEISRVLDKASYQLYLELARKQDAEFNAFMQGGTDKESGK